MSAQLGPGAWGAMRQEVIEFCTHWPPILQAQRDGTLVLETISPEDQKFLHSFKVPAMLGWGRAMLEWPAVKPADFLCPALWLIGSEDLSAMESLKEFEASLVGSKVQAQVLEGLNHEQVFDDIDRVFPTLLAFTRAQPNLA